MTTTETAPRTRITDPKRKPDNRAMKRVWLLENLIFDKRTGAGERAAAERQLDRALETARQKGEITETADNDSSAGVWYGYRLPSIRYGAKYEEVKNLSLTEIAKRIREDIKLARKVEEKLGAASGSDVALVDSLAALAAMPKTIKVSVRTDYFSGGGSIDVRLYNLPEKGWGYVKETDYLGYDRWVPNAELAGIIKALEEIHRTYNFDGSDSMVDYFHVNYYGHVEVDWRERP